MLILTACEQNSSIWETVSLLELLEEDADDLKSVLSVEKEDYLGETRVKAYMKLYNQSDNTIKLTFNTSQRYDLYLEKEGSEVWRYSDDKTFLDVIEDVYIEPGETLEYSRIIDYDFEPGIYKISAEISSYTLIELNNVEFEFESENSDPESLQVRLSIFEPALEDYPVDDLNCVIGIYNPSEEDIELMFNTSQHYELYLEKEGQIVWRFSDDKGFTDAVEYLTIESKGRVFYQVDIDYEFEAGEYKLLGEITSNPPIESNEVEFIVYGDLGDPADLETELSIDKDVDNRELRSTISLYNPSEQTIKLTFPSSQRYDLYLEKEGSEVWRYSDDKTFLDVIEVVYIEPGETLEYSRIIDYDFEPGIYKISAEISSYTLIELNDLEFEF
ncbi:BsuPI-related putative proteinase inhibitor [Natronospora cellulosivora (SeqCode)]